MVEWSRDYCCRDSKFDSRSRSYGFILGYHLASTVTSANKHSRAVDLVGLPVGSKGRSRNGLVFSQFIRV